MSNAIIRAIQHADRPGASDAFGRMRVSDPQTIFDWSAQYDEGPLLWQEVTAGSGSAAHNANESAVDLAVTTASGDIVIRQSRAYHRYQPGKSQLILATFVMGAGQTNTVQRVGYFDANDGIFLELNGTDLGIVLRTSTSGSPVDTKVSQADWNGESVPTNFDISKAQIFFIDLEWLGVGLVRVGFVIDGEFRVVHQFKNANSVDKVYMKTANLPVRYEIRNTGTAAAGATLQAICCSVISEGGFETERGIPFCASNGGTLKGVTTSAVPVLSLRPKAQFNSIDNRAQILIQSVNGISFGDPVYVQLVYNGTLTSATFASVNNESVANADTSAVSISGGQVINAFYIPAAGAPGRTGQGTNDLGVLSRLPLTIEVSGSAEATISVVAQAIGSAGASANVSTALFWQELK